MKHAFFRTLPGRALVIGIAVKIAVFALSLATRPPSIVDVIDTIASVAIVLGAVYFLGQGIALANRRLLWKVRRKLIISYIFIGFIPSILIIAFFLLGGLFLFSNFSAYLVQNEIRAVEDRTTSIAGGSSPSFSAATSFMVQSYCASCSRALIKIANPISRRPTLPSRDLSPPA